jgi:hypothetical protein
MAPRSNVRALKRGATIDRSEAYSAIVSLADWPSEDDERYADRVLAARYARGVTRRAQEYVTELRAGEHADAEALDDRMREEIDGDHDVIYTRAAATVGYVSRYDWQAEWEELGSDKAPTTEQIAYLCIMGDVREEIETLLGESVSSYLDSRADESCDCA